METTLFVFGEINEAMALSFVQALRKNATARAAITINSYGGGVSSALGMLAALRLHRGPIAIEIQGVCASAATLICCAGPVAMAADALAMIHAPWGEAQGTARHLVETADVLEKYVDSMVVAYTGKLSKSADEIRAWLTDDKDHWLSAEEALAIGLVDQIIPARRVAAQLGHLNPPKRFFAMPDPMSTVQAVTDVTALQDAARREVMAAETNRRREIKNLLVGPLARRKELVEVMNACLDDMTVTVAEASQRLLRKQGEGVCSIGGSSAIGSIGGAGAVSTPITFPSGSLTREFYESERIGNPIGFGGHHDFMAAASDALALRLGGKIKKPHPAAQDFQNAGLLGFASLFVAQSGTSPVGMSRAQLAKAAMTTSDLPELLSNTANKVLGTRLEQIAQDHRALCDKGDLVDFKPAKIVNTSFLPGLVRKYEHGEIEYGNIIDGATSYQLLTFARGLLFSREAITNDDLDSIGVLLRNAAASAARLERDLIFSILTDNPATGDANLLFSAAHGNLDSSSAAIDISGLNKARVLMRTQRDQSGGYVLTDPRFLVVPVGHEADAEALLASLTYRPATNTEMTTPAWIKSLIVIADPRLDADNPDDWYLLSDPTVAPTIKLGYLNGKDTPEVLQDVEFNTDVIRFKIRFDVACAPVGWSGAVKMA